MTDFKFDSWYPIEPLSPRSDSSLQRRRRKPFRVENFKCKRNPASTTATNMLYIFVTDEPEHSIPFQESPHGSPPLDFQLLSAEAEFKLVYITLRAETEKKYIKLSCQGKKENKKRHLAKSTH